MTPREKLIESTDPLELKVAEILNQKGINFIHESQGYTNGLDFYIPEAECYIECKAYHADRVVKQLEKGGNVILIQGYKALTFFSNLTLKNNETTQQNKN